MKPFGLFLGGSGDGHRPPLQLMALVLALAGCASTTIEKNVQPTAPSYAGGSRTSGFLHWIYAADGKTVAGAAFNAEGRENYDYLLGKYGAALKPPRTADFGVTINGPAVGSEEYDLNAEACTDFGEMATWDRSSEHLPKTFWQKIAGGRGE